ncbi:MAG: 50S ribosomal protein L6 [bacterium]
MSRIGNKIIEIPEAVEVSLNGQVLEVKSQDKKILVNLHPLVEVAVEKDTLKVSRKNELKLAKSIHGLMRSLIYNAIVGVSEGFKKELELVGVGYRALVEGNVLKLKVGYSHEVEITAPEGIDLEVKKNIISVSGIDKQLVGQIAADIRAVKKPEPYKGKGIKYVGEKVIRKVGKAVKSAGE